MEEKKSKFSLKALLSLILVIIIFKFLQNVPSLIKQIHPKKGDFIKVGKMSEPRWGHEAILLDDGNVLIFGGKNVDRGVISVNIYNSKTKKFTKINNMLKKKGYFNPTKLNNGKVLILGGYRGYAVAGTQFYNPQKRIFEEGPSMNYPRAGATAIRLLDGNVLVVGGQDLNLNLKKIQSTGNIEQCEIYNRVKNKFILGPKLNIPRFDHSSILLKDGRVLIVGGSGYSNKNFYKLSSAEIYDPKTNKFQLIGNMNVPKIMSNLYVLKNGNVLITNAFDREIEIYNPKTNKFKVVAKRTSNADMPTEVLLNDDKILFTGGCTGVGLSLKYYKYSETFDPQTNQFTTGKDMNFLRAGHKMTLLEDGNVLVSGSEGTNRTTELYINEDKK